MTQESENYLCEIWETFANAGDEEKKMMEFFIQTVDSIGKNYDRNLSYFRTMLSTYRKIRKTEPENGTVRIVQNLIKRHADLCRTGDHIMRRQHNSFVAYYAAGARKHDIAAAHGESLRTVYRDIDATIDRMMVMLFGIDGVHQIRE